MKIAVVGAAGKTGRCIVREGIGRGHEIVGLCREASAAALGEFDGDDRFTLATGPLVSDADLLTRGLAGCEAVIAVMISVKKLKATALVAALAKATAAHGITRVVFTAGEITVPPAPGEALNFRQRLMRAILPPLVALTPYSLSDMIAAGELVRMQEGWDWAVVRAPNLHDRPAAGYRFLPLAEVTAKDGLSRADYAAALLDAAGNPRHHDRLVTVASARN